MKKTAKNRKINKYIDHFCKYRLNANDIIEDRELYINELFKKYKDIYNPDDNKFTGYPGEYLDWMGNNLGTVLVGYKINLKTKEEIKMWNDFDKFTIVRDKNGKKKTSKEKLTYLLQNLPDSILVEFNGIS
jgi:hypothetical protein